MVTSIASGLGASFGISQESTVGTATTASMRWLRFDNESFALKKTTAQSTGLHQGMYLESRRRSYTQRSAEGSVTLDLGMKQLGLVLKHMLGTNASATQVGGTAAYLQTATPGDTVGLGLTVQVGRPLTTGVIQQFTYPGSKITEWEISVAKGELAKLTLGIDSFNEEIATAYSAPSMTATDIYAGQNCVVKIGGTPSTSVGVTSISGNAAPTGIVTAVSIKGTNTLKTDRIRLGSILKSEQVITDFRTVEVNIECDFTALADFYTQFAADTGTPLQVTFTGGVAGGANNYFLDIIIPSFWVDEDPINAEGPEVITANVKGVALDNAADNLVQVQYQSTDTSV